jgi:hypothetical protein
MDTAPSNALAAPAVAPARDPGPDASWVDEALAPFRDFLGSLAATADPLVDETIGLRMTLESLRLSLPFTMDARAESDGRVLLAGGPPTQYTETSFQPVYHQLHVRIEATARDSASPSSPTDPPILSVSAHDPDAQR